MMKGYVRPPSADSASWADAVDPRRRVSSAREVRCLMGTTMNLRDDYRLRSAAPPSWIRMPFSPKSDWMLALPGHPVTICRRPAEQTASPSERRPADVLRGWQRPSQLAAALSPRFLHRGSVANSVTT
jgi:hypothetical protein